MDPYKLFNLNKDFTPDQLRATYRKLALVFHPDKQGGNDYMFKVLTQCYKQLARDYNRRVSDRQFHELKSESRKHSASAPKPALTPDEAKKSFNIERFNQVFEQHKLPDAARDAGYNDWLRTGDDGKAAPKIQGKFTQKAFNEQFEKANAGEQSKHLVKYKEPEAMWTGKKLACTELGQTDVDDFSGDNMTRKALNYMDLKLAHTTSRIVDPKTVAERKAYKSIGDVEADRANVRYHMTDEELREYESRKKREELLEKKRLEALNAYDQRSLEHYEKVNRMMLGRRG